MTASWPGDSRTVVAWVRGALARLSVDDELTISGLDRVKVSADLDETDLRHLTLDVTGVTVGVQIHDIADPAPTTSDQTPEDSAEPEPVAVYDGVARDFRFIARPVRIERTRVDVEVQLHDVPIRWLTFAEATDPAVPSSRYGLVPAEDAEGMRGHFHASVRVRDIAPLLVSVLRPPLREAGVRLGRVRLDVTPDGVDGIRVAAYAGLRWKLLSASARATARIGVSRDAVVTVRDLTVGSRNPLVTFALLFARRPVRELVGRTLDLNAELAEDGAAIRIHDVRMVADTRLAVSARFS